WHNSDDCVAGRTQGYRAAHDAGILPKAVSPEALANDCNELVSRLVFLISECSALYGLHTQHFKGSCSHSGATEAFRVGVIGYEVKGCTVYRGKSFKGCVLLSPIQEVPR